MKIIFERIEQIIALFRTNRKCGIVTLKGATRGEGAEGDKARSKLRKKIKTFHF